MSSLKNALRDFNHRKLLFLVDIEGQEYNLFQNNFCEKFSKATFIQKKDTCHCFAAENISRMLFAVAKTNFVKKRFFEICSQFWKH